MPTTLTDTGEFGFLAQLLPRLWRAPGTIIGVGDDCALVQTGSRALLVTTDALIEGVHFRRGWMTPRQLGRRAYLVNASDIAAMGGNPRFVLVSIGAPARTAIHELHEIHRGIAAAAKQHGAAIVGGNLSRASELVVSLTVIGDSPARPLRRRGARIGDALFLTGELGAAALGVEHLRHGRRSGAAIRRFREPIPRVRAGAVLARERIASAAIDVSDGLLQDLHHLCAASGVGARVDLDALPCTSTVLKRGVALALRGGEDYELLCTVPPDRLARMERFKRSMGCRISRIGRVMPARHGIQVVDAAGDRVTLSGNGGFDHFAGGLRQ